MSPVSSSHVRYLLPVEADLASSTAVPRAHKTPGYGMGAGVRYGLVRYLLPDESVGAMEEVA